MGSISSSITHDRVVSETPDAPLPAISIASAAVTAIGLRWVGIGSKSLWFDEGYTAWITSLPAAEIVRVIQADTAPPLYYLLLHFWRMIFGDSEAALRGLSAMFATLSIPIFYLLARRILKHPPAIAAAMWLFALSPMQVFYSKEARFYEMMSLICLTSVYALICFLHKRSLGLFMSLVLLMAGGLYTNNLMILYIAGLNAVWMLYPSPQSRRRRGADMLAANAVVALLYLPWFPVLLEQARSLVGNFWIASPTFGTLARTVALLVGVKIDGIPTHAWPINGLPLAVNWQLIIASLIWIIAGILIAAALRNRCNVPRQATALLIYALLPVLAAFAYSHFKQPIFLDKMFIGSTPILAIVMAMSMRRRGCPQRPRIAIRGLFQRLFSIEKMSETLMGVMIALSAISVVSVMLERKEDWRGAAAYVDNLPSCERLLVFVANDGELPFMYYAWRLAGDNWMDQRIGLPRGFFDADPPRTMRRIRGDADLALLHTATDELRFQELVLIASHLAWADPDRRALKYLQQHWNLLEHQRLHKVGVYRFVR